MLPQLFKECIELLDDNTVILSQKDSNKIFEDFENLIPIVSWGRVDWDKIDRKVFVDSADQIISALKELLGQEVDASVYVLWNDGSLPVIKSDLQILLKHIDDVVCVAPDTWFWNISMGYIIEIYHEDEGYFIGLITKVIP